MLKKVDLKEGIVALVSIQFSKKSEICCISVLCGVRLVPVGVDLLKRLCEPCCFFTMQENTRLLTVVSIIYTP